MTEYKIGDAVSYGIGGDRYYDGLITRITQCYITTDSGNRYYRRETAAGRVRYTQVACVHCYLVPGRVEHYDPQF